MDVPGKRWYFSAMVIDTVPTWQLYGEQQAFPDILHVERIIDRAAGLDWAIAPHRHLHLHQLFLLLSGTVRLTIDGAVQEPSPPVVINMPRGTVHGFAFSAGTEGFVLTLPASSFPDLFDASAETSLPLRRSFTLAAHNLEARLETISALHAGRQPFRRTLLRAEAMALASTILAMAPEGQTGRETDPRIVTFEALVRQFLTENRRMEDFAAKLAMSPRHLSRLCKAETGHSAQNFVEALKMHEACRLLVYTRMSAQQVAYHLGYEDPAYFSRAFKRSLRLSPSAYRSHFDGR
jgi:AraC family transcriptional activator of pobA